MSRSKHTDPASIRASRRVSFGPHSIGDLAMRRTLRTLSLVFDTPDGNSTVGNNGDCHPASRPRILWQQPRPGFHHPVGKREVLELLKAIGNVHRLRTTKPRGVKARRARDRIV